MHRTPWLDWIFTHLPGRVLKSRMSSMRVACMLTSRASTADDIVAFRLLEVRTMERTKPSGHGNKSLSTPA